nr:MAG TPA: hypothetical protein [Caudoviricetes sp.]
MTWLTYIIYNDRSLKSCQPNLSTASTKSTKIVNRIRALSGCPRGL